MQARQDEVIEGNVFQYLQMGEGEKKKGQFIFYPELK